jgi:hypothetical protein
MAVKRSLFCEIYVMFILNPIRNTSNKLGKEKIFEFNNIT